MAIKQGELKISSKTMADFTYALIMCKCQLVGTYGIGIYQLTRKQNNRHKVDFIISIEEDRINCFEELSGIKLNNPIQAQLN